MDLSFTQLKFDNFNDILTLFKKKLLQNNTYMIMKESKREKISKELKLKIENECRYKDFAFNEVIEKIQNDYMYATFFAKDPMKQNLAEKLQLRLLKLKYPNVKKLPNNGKNSIYISDGNIVSLSNIKDKTTKSIDFWDPVNKIFFYAKYINEKGGAQDNQFEDCKSFVREARSTLSINFKLIIDGDYFNEEKINILKSINTNNNIQIEKSFDNICLIKTYDKSNDILFLDISLDSL